jgi:hypothetical protein
LVDPVPNESKLILGAKIEDEARELQGDMEDTEHNDTRQHRTGTDQE